MKKGSSSCANKKKKRHKNPNGEGGYFGFDAPDQRKGWKITINGKQKVLYLHKNETRKHFTERVNEFKANLIYMKPENAKDRYFGEYITYWSENFSKSKLSPKSYDLQADTIRINIVPVLGDMKLGLIQDIDIQNLLTEMINHGGRKGNGYSLSQINKVYTAINQCFCYAVKRGDVRLNPCTTVQKPTEKAYPQLSPRKVRAMNDNEINDYITAALEVYKNGKRKYSNGDMLAFILLTGLRKGEAIGLKWNDVDINSDNGWILISRNVVTIKNPNDDGTHYKQIEQSSPKTQAGKRYIALNDLAKSILLERKKTSKEYVFETKNGTLISGANLKRTHNSICTNCGISEITIHGLRHSFGSLLVRNGKDINTVSELMGHKDPSTTRSIYIHVMPEQKQEAVRQLDKIDAVTDMLRGNHFKD